MKVDLEYYYNNPELYNVKKNEKLGLASIKYRTMGVDWSDKRALNARGLIVDYNTGDVIAKPYDKFFNFGQILENRQLEEELSSWPNDISGMEVTEKLDGSLGIMYTYKDNLMLSSSGTVVPDALMQWPERVEKFFTKEVRDKLLEIGRKYTLLFEVLDPDNTIVIKHDTFSLVLHGIIETSTGKDLSRGEILALLGEYDLLSDLQLTPIYTGINTLDDINAVIKTLVNKEGFVVRFPGGKRLKFKTDDYVAFHRSVDIFGATTIKNIEIWTALFILDELDDILSKVSVSPFYNKSIEMDIQHFLLVQLDFTNLINVLNNYIKKYDNNKDRFVNIKELDGYSAETTRQYLGIVISGNERELENARFSYTLASMTGKNRGMFHDENRKNLNDRYLKDITNSRLKLPE